MIAKTDEQIKILRAGGKILAGVIQDVITAAKEGVTTAELDLLAEHAIRARGGIPSFLNYQPDGAPIPYPAALCVAINDEVVHGIPSENRILHNGDVVSFDLGLSYQGLFVDSARTVCIGGTCDPKAQILIDAAKEAHRAAVAACVVGGHMGDIGAAVVRVARNHGLGVVEDLGGHGVGESVHEKPFIANDGKEGEGERIVEGMVLAIEPMLAEGKGSIVLDEDEWTYRMEDGKRAAHVEDTILVTKNGPEVLTIL